MRVGANRSRSKVLALVLGLSALCPAPAHAMIATLVDRVAFVGAYLELTQRQKPDGAEQRWLERPGARLESWLFRPPGQPGPVPAVLYFHGNAELIDVNVPLANAYLAQGYAVLLAEYRGFGRSTGTPSSASLPGDALAFFDLLASQPGIDPTRIVVAGRSLGGSAAAATAENRPACALVLESTFTSLADMVASAGVPGVFPGTALASRTALNRFEGPILVMHGRADEVVPFSQGEALASTALARPYGSERARFVAFPGGHNPMAPLRDIQTEIHAFLTAQTNCSASPRPLS